MISNFDPMMTIFFQNRNRSVKQTPMTASETDRTARQPAFARLRISNSVA